MSFVVVLSGAQAALAREVEAALRRQQIDACAPLHEEIRSLRASIWRSLVVQASAVIAVWTQQDLEDRLFWETLLSAAASGKLIAASADGSPPPAHPSFPALTPCSVEALVKAATRCVAPAREAIVAREYTDLRRACARGTDKAWRAFLRRRPKGVFHALVRAELDLAVTPAYRARRIQFDDAVTPWRMRGPAKMWGGVALGALVVGAALIFAGVRAPFDGGAIFWSPPLAPPVHQEAQAPPVSAGATGQVQPALVALATPEKNVAGNVAAQSLLTPTQPAPVSAPSAPLVVSTSQQLQRSAEPSALMQRAAPASLGVEPLRVASISGQRANDAELLEPGLRAVVEQARRRQSYAQGQAARSGRARILANTEGAGSYQGDWANGGPSGLGAANWTDGARYEGSWRGSKPNGMGVLSLASGIRYEGEFDNGAPTGRGVFWSGDGRRITGEALFRALVAARSAGPSPSSESESDRSASENAGNVRAHQR